MLVVMKAQATPEEIQAVCDHIEQLGFRRPSPSRSPAHRHRHHRQPGRSRSRQPRSALRRRRGHPRLQGLQTGQPRRQGRRHRSSAFPALDAAIGGRDLAIIAGPCSIESREQAFAIAEQVAASGAQFFRGGAYKPRTSPYAFQGLGLDALKIMSEIGKTSACASSPKPSTTKPSTWSPNGPT